MMLSQLRHYGTVVVILLMFIAGLGALDLFQNNFVHAQDEPESSQTTEESGSAAAESEDSSSEDDFQCESVGALGWLICPFVDGLYSFIFDLYENFILTNLVVDPLSDSADPDSPEALIYQIWNNFRVIANILFVAVFIIATFSTATGFIFSAYDIKRILPRLVLAVIGIQLSWYFVGFMVDLFNVIGAGLRGIMLAPVQDIPLSFDFSGTAEGVGTGLTITAVLIGRYALGLRGLLFVLPFILMPIVVMVITTVLVIVFRKMLIFLLIVISPVAFVAFVLPGTESLFKMWWSLFSKALMMYPLAVAIIAGGELAARILVEGQDAGALIQISGMVALFAPFFLIPTTFKMAGGAIASISNGLNKGGAFSKEKVYGDPRDKRSLRGRGRAERKKRMMNRGMDFNRRHKGTMIGAGAYKNAAKGARSAWGGRTGSTRRGRAWSGAKGVAGSMRGTGLGPRGVVGGLWGTAATRLGPNWTEQYGHAAAEADKWAAALADSDPDMLMGVLGLKDNILMGTPGNHPPLAQRYIDAGARFQNDPAKVQAASKLLMHISRGEETRDHIRGALNGLADKGKLSHGMADDVWYQMANSDLIKKQIPNLKYTDRKTGKIKAGYVPEFLRKYADTETKFAIDQFKPDFWNTMQDAERMYRDGTMQSQVNSGKMTQDEFNRGKKFYNELRQNTLRDGAQSFLGLRQNEFNAYLKDQGVQVPDGKGGMRDARLESIAFDSSNDALLRQHLVGFINDTTHGMGGSVGSYDEAAAWAVSNMPTGQQSIQANQAMKSYISTARDL